MNSLGTKDQGTGVLERVIYGVAMFILTKFVAKGYLDADMAAYLAGGTVTIIGGAYAWWVNRPKAIVQSAAALPNTTVVTTAALAADTKESNIVSNTAMEVVTK